MVVEYFERSAAGERLEKVSRPRSHAWVHISGKLLDMDDLSDKLLLNANILRDVCDVRELSRAEFSNGVEYIFLRLPVGLADAAKTAPILIAVSRDRLVTASPHTSFSPLDTDAFMTTDTRQPSAVVSAVIASIITEYEQRLHALSTKITSARKRLTHFDVQNEDFVEFVAIEDSLNEYRSGLEGLVTVVSQLEANRRQLFNLRDIEAFGDIILHARQLLVAISSSTQTIDSIQNAYSTIANNTLNQRMKVLTTITILLAVPNVFYGMYGMNIGLPFQGEWWAYAAIMGITLLLILLTLLLAKRFRLF